MAKKTLLIIPCLDEEAALPKVLADLPELAGGLRVLVVDNGSTDRSAEIARAAGAELVREEERGYGAACLRGLAELRDEEFVAFMDADYSDHPEELAVLVQPLMQGEADFVLGSRMLLPESKRALPLQSRFGNRLASLLLRFFFRHRCTDLGPFRVLTASALLRMKMRDRGYGWTVEMQAKAALLRLRFQELPVHYRERIGTSKITGTLRGSFGASWKILFTILRLRWAAFRGR